MTGAAAPFTRYHDTTRQTAGQSIAPVSSFVRVAVYPTAGEASICVVVPRREDAGPGSEAPAAELDAGSSWERANVRARSRSRRYITANRLRYMWVLTFSGSGLHGADGRRECMSEVAQFVRRLGPELRGGAYWYSPELHPGGHGWHVNLFVGRRIPHADLEKLWRRGYVWVKDWTRDSRVKGATFLERLRAGASYGAKYAAKDWSVEMLERGAHRYELAQGHEPLVVLAETDTLAAGLAVAEMRCGPAVRVWRSSDDDEWEGPPCWVAFFGGPSG